MVNGHVNHSVPVRLLGIAHTKSCTKFEVSSSCSFGDIDAAMVDMTLNDL